MLNAAEKIKDLEAALSLAFNESFEATSTDYTKFTMTQNFSDAALVLGWLGEFADLREWIGERDLKDIDAFGYRVKPVNYELTHSIDLNDLNDTLIANAANIQRANGQSAKRHPQKLVTALLRDGHVNECYDGQPFFSDSHPVIGADGEETTYSNIQTGTSTPWFLLRGDGAGQTNVIKPFIFGERTGQGYDFKVHQSGDMTFMTRKVAFGVDARVAAAYGLPQFAFRSTKALTADNLESAVAAMDSIKGHNGVEIDNTPNLLVVPPSLRFAAEKLINKASNGSGGDNIHYKRFEIVVLKGLQDVPDSEASGGDGGEGGEG